MNQTVSCLETLKWSELALVPFVAAIGLAAAVLGRRILKGLRLHEDPEMPGVSRPRRAFLAAVILLSATIIWGFLLFIALGGRCGQ